MKNLTAGFHLKIYNKYKKIKLQELYNDDSIQTIHLTKLTAAYRKSFEIPIIFII